MDAAARREARRRKILENANNRLKKITGVDENNCDLSNCAQEIYSGVEEDESAEIPYYETINETVPQEVATQNKHLVKWDLNNLIIIFLAIIVSFTLFICKYYEVNVFLTKIFLPLILYKVTVFYWFPQSASPAAGLLYILLISNLNNSYLKYSLNILNFITSITQDLMLYFFVFICCNLVKTLVDY